MNDMLKAIVTGAAGAILAFAILAAAEKFGGWFTSIFGSSQAIPAGAIVAYAGKKTAPPRGWEICGLHDSDLPSFDGRFLVGTYNPTRVGEWTGAETGTHKHGVSIRSTGERGGRARTDPEGADNQTGAPNWYHEHHVVGETVSADHIPPAIEVIFFCKL